MRVHVGRLGLFEYTTDVAVIFPCMNLYFVDTKPRPVGGIWMKIRSNWYEEISPSTSSHFVCFLPCGQYLIHLVWLGLHWSENLFLGCVEARDKVVMGRFGSVTLWYPRWNLDFDFILFVMSFCKQVVILHIFLRTHTKRKLQVHHVRGIYIDLIASTALKNSVNCKFIEENCQSMNWWMILSSPFSFPQ